MVWENLTRGLPVVNPNVQLWWGDFDIHNIEQYTHAKFLDYVSFDQVAIGRLDLTIPNSGLGLHEHLPIAHWCCDQHGTCGWLMAIGSQV